MKSDIEELADLLDPHIEKGLKLEKSKSKIETYEEEIAKSLSFNPYSPHVMTEDSPYYNPYLLSQEGGFYPHQLKTLDPDGVHADGYDTVRQFWAAYGEAPSSRHSIFSPQTPATQAFSRFAKSIGDYVIKGGPVPVGTVHTFSDGNSYKKMGEGKWLPVAGRESRKWSQHLTHENPKHREMANKEMESHAAQTLAVKEALKQKMREEKVIGEATNRAVQAAAEHTKKVTQHTYGGQVPKEISQAHDEHIKQYGGAKPTNPKDHLKKLSEGLKGPQHHVTAHFSFQGKDYTHKFENVQAAHHSEAANKVQEALKKKFPGAAIKKLHAETPKEKENSPQGEQNA